VQPSLYEGFGLPPLEAMACGCPVIVSDRGALPETAGPAALVTQPTAEALAENIDRMLGDRSLRERMRRAGADRVQQFDWDRTARDTLELYRSVCRDHFPERS
jgi:glycosyltransferase involved in cell wall biosynthesis